MRYFLILAVLFSTHTFAAEAYVAGVLRNTGDGWYVLNDEGHEPINIASVDNDSKTIVIRYGKSFSKVRTLVVTADETYAVKYGLVCGASVNREKATIMCSSDGEHVDPNDLKEPWGNLWVYGLFAE